MAIVTEDGTGKADAETYITVAAADTYHTNHGQTAWLGDDTTIKEPALRAATQYLDVTFKRRWKGRSVTKEQALDWPRHGVKLEDGWVIDSDEIPADLTHAVAELALHALTEELIPNIDTPGTVRFKGIKVGPIEDRTSYSGGTQEKFFRLASGLVDDLIESGSVITLGIR